MSIIKAIKKCEYDFEVRAEKFLVASSCTWIFFHLCRNAFDRVMCCLCDYNCFCFSNVIAFWMDLIFIVS